MFRTSNPTLNEKVFERGAVSHGLDANNVMTLQGTVHKCGIAIFLTIAAAMYSWSNPWMMKLYIPLAIASLVLVVVSYFKMSWAPVLTPTYALVKGTALGSISLVMETQYPGVVMQALAGTFGTFVFLLLAYQSRLIRADENFKLGVVAATGGIFFLYLIALVGGLFGFQMSFMHDSSPLSIGISVAIVVVAALNLVLDFDFIENASEAGNQPKFMEWFAALGLLVTLVWLYVELLRLLSKLRK